MLFSLIRMRFTRINATTKSNKAEAMKNEEFNSKNTKVMYVTVCVSVFSHLLYAYTCANIQCIVIT